jgi:DNA-binding NtrC family response regulator
VSGYQRILHREFDVSSALDGKEGLASIRTMAHSPSFSDMRMPGMNGAQFFRRFDKRVDTVRMLLTGHTDLNAAKAGLRIEDQSSTLRSCRNSDSDEHEARHLRLRLITSPRDPKLYLSPLGSPQITVWQTSSDALRARGGPHLAQQNT